MAKITTSRVLSRKLRILRNVALVLVLVMLVYVVRGFPPLSAEVQFRRAELAQGLGPSEILADVHLNDFDMYLRYTYDSPTIVNYGIRLYAHVIIASSEYGATLYTYWDDTARKDGILHYQEKENGFAVCVVPGRVVEFTGAGDRDLAIVAFDNIPEAVEAKIWMPKFSSLYRSFKAERTGEGYFLFRVGANPILFPNSYDEYHYDDAGVHYEEGTPYEIFYYDKDGAVVAMYSGKIQSVVARAHEEQEQKKPME